MASNYPGSLDQFTTKLFGETIVASHVNDLQDAVEALQAKVGIGVVGVSIGASNSLDWFVRSASSVSPGHKHTSSDISGGLAEADIARPGSPILARIAQNETISGNWSFTGSGGLKVTAGYGSGGAAHSHLVLGAAGSSPNAASIVWGSNSGWKLHFGTMLSSVFTPRVTMVDTGYVGIGTTAPLVRLHVEELSHEGNWTSTLHSERGAFTLSGPSSWVSMSVHDSTTGNMCLKFVTEKVGASPCNFIFAPGSAASGAFSLERVWYYQGVTGWSYLPGSVLVNTSNLPFSGSVTDERGRGYFAAYFYDDVYGANVFLCGGRGTSTPFAGGTPAPPANDDQLAALIFGGNSAAGGTPAYRAAASVEAFADGVWSDTSWPAELLFFTTPRNYTSGRVDRARITRSGHLLLGPGDDATAFPHGANAATAGPFIMFANTLTAKLILYRTGSPLTTESFGLFVDSGVLRYAVGSTGTNVHGFDVGSTRVVTIGVDVLRADRGLATTRGDVSLVNGTNNNVNAQGRSYLKVSGPTGSYTITGFSGGVDGQRLVVQNAVAQNLTLTHADAASSAGNRLYLFGGGSLTLTGTGTGGGGSAEFIYDLGSASWILLHARQAGVSGGTPK